MGLHAEARLTESEKQQVVAALERTLGRDEERYAAVRPRRDISLARGECRAQTPFHLGRHGRYTACITSGARSDDEPTGPTTLSNTDLEAPCPTQPSRMRCIPGGRWRW